MIVEVVSFTVARAEGFEALNDRYQEDVAYQSRGLARRTVARNDAGRWIDIRLWADDASREMAGDDSVRRAWDDAVEIDSREIYRGL